MPPPRAGAGAWPRAAAARLVAASLLALLVGYNAGWTVGRQRSAGVFGERPAGSLLGGAKAVDGRRAREACAAGRPGGKVWQMCRQTCARVCAPRGADSHARATTSNNVGECLHIPRCNDRVFVCEVCSDDCTRRCRAELASRPWSLTLLCTLRYVLSCARPRRVARGRAC